MKPGAILLNTGRGAPAVADPNRSCNPHISGGWHLKETHTCVVNIFTENLKRFLAGEPLKNQVDFQVDFAAGRRK